MALPKYEGKIPISATTTVCNVAGTAISVAADDYYLNTSRGSVSGFLPTLQAAIQLLVDPAYTVTISDDTDSATGKVTIASNGSNFTINSWDSELRSVLGFTQSSYSGAATYTGENQARYLWLPNVGRTRPMAPEYASSSGTNMGARETDFSFALSPSGYNYSTSFSTRYVDRMAHFGVSGSKMWIANESTTNESLEKFYADVIGKGLSLRYHPDRSSDTVKWSMVVANGGEFKPSALNENWTGASSLWQFEYEIRAYLGD